MDMEMDLPALYRVSGHNSEGAWVMLVKARSPAAALHHAMVKNTWDILKGVHIAVEPNFYDMMEHEALAAAVAKAATDPHPIPA